MNCNLPRRHFMGDGGRETGKADYRHVLGHFATGVTVVTTLAADGRLAGFTANAFTAVSLEPPLVLVCVDYRARSYEAIRSHGKFAVHVLADDQAEVAKGFAEKAGDKDRVCAWTVDEHGYPILERCHALLACRLHQEFAGGDHAVLLGYVERLEISADAGAPLLFYRGRMHDSSMLRPIPVGTHASRSGGRPADGPLAQHGRGLLPAAQQPATMPSRAGTAGARESALPCGD